VGVTVYGVVGYRVLEGWSLLDALYMTVITLATVGFREVQPLGPRGQASTIFLILAGVMALFVALGAVTELVVSGQLVRVLRKTHGRPYRSARPAHRDLRLRPRRPGGGRGTGPPAPAVRVVERQQALVPTLEEQGIPYIAADAAPLRPLVHVSDLRPVLCSRCSWP
jgi:Ion channel